MTRADLEAVRRIEVASFPDPWPESIFLQEILSGGHSHCMVVKRDQERTSWSPPVGYVCFWTLDEELLINNLAVDPRQRTRGLGTYLLKRTIQEGRACGCRVAYLEVRPSNTPALKLYEKGGFEVIGRRKGYYQSTGEDALLMRACLESRQNRVL